MNQRMTNAAAKIMIIVAEEEKLEPCEAIALFEILKTGLYKQV